MSDSVSITPPLPGDWQATVGRLDRYRWKQLRLRHGHLGTAIRFCRDAFLDILWGLQARQSLKKGSAPSEPCDFLLLQGAPKVIALQRKKKLIDQLRAHGHTLIETAQEEPGNFLKKGCLSPPPQKVPLRYLCYAAYAQWLVSHYNPSVLINDRNGSLVSPFLRLSLHQQGKTLVHLAHATTVESSRRLDMTDYDYYFLFGQSSLNALQLRPLRFGTTRVVLSGSHMIDSSYHMAPITPEQCKLLILGVGPDKEKERGYRETYTLLAQWSKRHPEFRVFFKPHPRSKATFWKEMATQSETIEVLSKDCSLAQALADASLVVNIMSNAVIEAALAQRPVLYVNAGQDEDIFEQEQFFGPKIDTLEALEHRIKTIQTDYNSAVDISSNFATHHLHYGTEGLNKSVAFLESLKQGRAIPSIVMEERL